MGLSVTEKEHIKELIETRINRAIEQISTENKEAVDSIKVEARAQAIDALGIGPKLDRLISIKKQIEALQEDKKGLEEEVIADLHIEEPQRNYYSSYNQAADVRIESKIVSASQSYERKLLNSHPVLGRIVTLKAEKEDLLQNVWIATSQAQVKALFEAINTLLGSKPTELETLAQKIPADQTPS